MAASVLPIKRLFFKDNNPLIDQSLSSFSGLYIHCNEQGKNASIGIESLRPSEQAKETQSVSNVVVACEYINTRNGVCEIMQKPCPVFQIMSDNAETIAQLTYDKEIKNYLKTIV
jgi:hypothetical protein